MTTDLHLSVDRSSPVPLYFQVAEQLERAITGGTLIAGERISNEIALAEQLGLSRPTMRQAIQTVVDKGLLVRKRGVGTQVVQSQVRRPLELTSLQDDLVRAGREPHTEVLGLERVEADAVSADDLQVRVGTPLWYLERLRLIGGQPLALLANLVPVDVTDLGSVDLTVTGLYEHLRAEGLHIRVAHQSIGARRADGREARLLTDRKGAPLLTMQRTAYDDGGRAVERGTHVYRPDLYSFEMTLVDR
ncbi:MAG: GntR family transcriptional regulator [Nocardioidaceae bacterium]